MIDRIALAATRPMTGPGTAAGFAHSAGGARLIGMYAIGIDFWASVRERAVMMIWHGLN